MWTVKTLIRLGGCPGWSESSLGAQSFCWFCHEAAHMIHAEMHVIWLSEMSQKVHASIRTVLSEPLLCALEVARDPTLPQYDVWKAVTISGCLNVTRCKLIWVLAVHKSSCSRFLKCPISIAIVFLNYQSLEPRPLSDIVKEKHNEPPEEQMRGLRVEGGDCVATGTQGCKNAGKYAYFPCHWYLPAFMAFMANMVANMAYMVNSMDSYQI